MNRSTSALLAALLGFGCEPPVSRVAATPSVAEDSPRAPVDSCVRSSPDCAAACALRELDQLEFVDWFDRRCAAVTRGKNADKTEGNQPPPAPSASAAPSSERDVYSNPYR